MREDERLRQTLRTGSFTTINTLNWSSAGSWSGSGWNLFNPNTLGPVGGAVGGGAWQEIINSVYQKMQSENGEKMIIRLLHAFGIFILICIPGMSVIYVVGAYLTCAFVDGCYSTLGIAGIFGTVSVTGILVRGGLLAVAFTLIVWPRIRQP